MGAALGTEETEEPVGDGDDFRERISNVLCTTRGKKNHPRPLPLRVKLARRFGTLSHQSSPLVHLDIDLRRRIVWALVAGGNCMKIACALSATCYDMSECFQTEKCWLWESKVSALLGQRRRRGVGSKTQCIGFMSARRFLHCALTCCDWLALVEAHEVLEAVGMGRAELLVPAYQALLSNLALPLSLQILHWLWDLATGERQPWSSTFRPTEETLQLEHVRSFAKDSLSASIELRRDLEAFDHMDEMSMKDCLSCSAALILVAAECTARSHIMLNDFGMVAKLIDIEAAIQAVLKGFHRTGQHRDTLWMLVMLLLTRVYQHSESQSLSLLCSQDLDLEPGWHGIALPGQSVGTSQNIERVEFPQLCVDMQRGWLHTQNGTLSPTQMRRVGSEGHYEFNEPKTWQLDARFCTDLACFFGQLVEIGASFDSLPAYVLPLQSDVGGLRQWTLQDDAFSCSKHHLAAKEDVVVEELIGIIGLPGTSQLRYVHLVHVV
eukprot:TRINITY_DN72408_c0_g1_i1.p1 TRINITY_DN72408_c0_g1~~TRINITY_DN72408_c0_g1_i1.p1  ORF type:complete len:512 (+),score=49.96 TRINITY_DN72408_c0_g1_i1:57-1538(+)